jgi:hypothetical protein
MYTNEQIKEAWDLAKSKGIRYFGDVGTNAKTRKSDEKTDFLSYIMYLAPSTQSGKYNTCPAASKGCAEACLFTAGHGVFKAVKEARIRRTHFYFEHPNEFKACLFSEIDRHVKNCVRFKKKPAARLNGTSDIVWEVMWPELFEHFKNVRFYDYTKIHQRMLPQWKLPKNYHLTFSRSESNEAHVEKVIQSNPKANVTVVFDELPKTWMGRKVINGDEMDLRILDPKGVIVGLKMKGDAKKDQSGFVIRAPITIKGKELQLA